MNNYKFNTLFKFSTKSKIKAGDGKSEGKYPFYTSSQELNKYIDVIQHDTEGLVFGTGGMASIHYVNGKFSTSTDCFVIIPKGNEFLTKYVYYFFIANFHILENGFKGAGLKHISKKYLEDIDIPIIDKDEQISIIKKLDKAQELIDLRKESIVRLEELAKSIFIDMFGDPVINPKRWDTKVIEEITKKEKYSIKRGPFGGALKKEIFVNEGYLVYEQYHALNNDFTFGRYFIDEKKFQELKAFEVHENDIIISCSGVYLGKLAIVPKNSKKGVINQALLKVSLDESIMKNIIFTNIFTNPNFKKKFFGYSIGSGIPNFPPMSDFKKFEFIVPPIELQNKFASIREKIEEQKSLYEQELKKLEENFQALLQQSFKE